MNHKDGDLICTGRIKDERYEIKRATNGFCGSIKDDYCSCSFFESNACIEEGGYPLCTNNVYFIKIEEV